MKKLAFFAFALALTATLLYSCKKKEEEFPKACDKPAAPTVTNNSPVAVGETITFTAQYVSGASYSWTGPNGFTSTAQNPSIVFNNNYIGAFKVTVTVDDCTSDPFYSYVTSLNITASSDTGIVTGGTLKLYATSVLDIYGQPINATYNWVGPNSFTSTVQNPSITAVTIAAAGIYTVTATSPNGNVGSPATVTVVITPKATIVSSNSANNQVAVDSTLNLLATAISGATSYSWTGPNGFTSTVEDPTIFPVTKANEGTYYLTYVENGITSKIASTKVKLKYSKKGCSGTTTVTLNSVVYNVVEIGTQCWFKENVKNGTIDSLTWEEANPVTSISRQGVCPTGWHVPNDTMWADLAVFVGGDGNALKDTGAVTGPITNPGKGTNTSGFSAMLNIGPTSNKSGIFWSSTLEASGLPRYMKLNKTNSLIYFDTGSKARKYYVRCLKD